ncbi:hypothetical protein IFR05_009321 [Cadophora sp. M221]|nr:hypothetical protein IFR05_009321 [Cadophora sp. M221]
MYVDEDEGRSNESPSLPTKGEAKKTPEDQSLMKEQDLRAEMGGMKTEMGLLREEMGELKGLVRKLLVVLESAGNKGGS